MKTTHAFVIALLVTSISASTRAAGLYFSERGVRPLGRGGAFVAGADDAGAIAYNPAGLSFAPHEILVDGSWLQYQSTYERSTLVRQTDPTTGQTQFLVIREAPVEATSPVLPIPTLAYVFPVGATFDVGLGIWAPYAAVADYPGSSNGDPAPQRYSLISQEGSALGIFGVYGAYRPVHEVALGVGVEVLGGVLETTVVMNACPPDRLTCAPEQPEYDAASRLQVGPILAPSGVVGLIWVPDALLRVGASFHLPWWVSAPATVDVVLPSTALFADAHQVGDDADVDFKLPWTLRAGVEVRPTRDTRVEAGVAYEAWSMHDAIALDPDGIALEGLQALPGSYPMTSIRFPRGFRDAWSVRAGGEQTLRPGGARVDVRAGLAYEASAVPERYLSVASLDLRKITASIGAGMYFGRLRLDLLAARVFGVAAGVDPSEAAVNHLYPIRSNPPADEVAINGGHYEASANVFGLGIAYEFEPPGTTMK